MSAGLMRAREPYRMKNMLTGFAVGTFVVGVWLYSMSAVKQDNFDDVDEEARAMARAGMKVVEDRGLERTADVAPPMAIATSPSSVTSGKEAKAKTQGLLALLDGKFPRLLDPKGKTMVWGAPPVDRVGRMSEDGKEDELGRGKLRGKTG
jgi:cytochrome c oxidase assembly factor 3, fungi type